MKEIYNNYIFVKKNKTCHIKIVELFLIVIVCKNCIHFQKSSSLSNQVFTICTKRRFEF